MSSLLADSLAFLFSRFRTLLTAPAPDPYSITDAGTSSEPLLPDVVAFSSQICAASRALEHERPPETRLFTDPLAEHLAGPVARRRARQRLAEADEHAAEMMSARIPIRTRYFDDFLGDAVAKLTASALPSSPPVQVVILGSGMDSRSYRILQLANSPDLQLFEVDQACVIELKERLLESIEPSRAPLCHVIRVAADLTVARAWVDALLAKGFNPYESRSVFIIEGLVYYFDEERVQEMLREVASLCSTDSLLCMSNVAKIGSQRQNISPATPSRDEPSFPQARLTESDAHTARLRFKFACPGPEVFLSKVGFAVSSIDYLGSTDANYGRWPASKQPSAKTMYIRFGLAEKQNDNVGA
jgi:methyltransferase (TIGR00027 family)